MPTTATQAGRPQSVTTAPDADTLLAQRYQAHEALSELFRASVDVAALADR